VRESDLETLGGKEMMHNEQACTEKQFADVKQCLERMGDDSFVIFLNRDGEVDAARETAQSDVAWRLQQEARARSCGPFWELVTFDATTNMVCVGGYLSEFPLHDDELADAVETAVGERELWRAS
jgi:hypothetical protein